MRNLSEEVNIKDKVIDPTRMQYLTLQVLFKGDDNPIPLAVAIPYIFPVDDVQNDEVKIVGIEITKPSDVPNGMEFEAEGESTDEDLESILEELQSAVNKIQEEDPDASENIEEGMSKNSEVQDKERPPKETS